ncbi:MAG: MBL fold metallo-hydrolase [Flavobacteriales bacterium]|nr:MAG: MBL fold metallo-hydrolase [Flavobacteriales bacterium]
MNIKLAFISILTDFQRYGLLILYSVIIGLCAESLVSCSKWDEMDSLIIKDYPNRQEDFSLWQLDAFFEEVQMGYILRCDDGAIIVIDGGGTSTAPILKGYLQQLGGKVNTWIVTHPHTDHMNALLEIINDRTILIDRILHVPLDEAWVLQNEATNFDSCKRYMDILQTSPVLKIDVEVGSNYSLGQGVEMEVLGGRNPSITQNAINNSSMVFKIRSKTKSVLFTGDLGDLGGIALLITIASERLKSDYVQMAHHGQGGVNKAFYTATNPKYALWPTPKWLWNNQPEGKSANSGNGKTFIVRQWMDEIEIERNFVSGLEGTIQID